MQTYSATRTQLKRRNGDIEHVRRSGRTMAPGHSLSPEEQASGDEDADAASESSDGARVDPSKGDATSTEDAKQEGGIRTSVNRIMKSEREPGKSGLASMKRKRKGRALNGAADAGLAADAGSVKKKPTSKRHEKATV